MVGSLAYKTPDLQSYMTARHGTLLWADLHGQKVPMDGRIPAQACAMLLIAIAAISGRERQAEAWLVNHSPAWLTNLTTRF
jgi:hypothetical protein